METKTENSECEICGKRFSKNSQLLKHKKVHNKSCEKCNKTFQSTKHKKQHYKLEHPQRKDKICKVCPDLSFSSEEELLKHSLDFHDGKIVCHMCSKCGKQFKTRGELTHHIKSNCGTIKLFPCKICGQQLMTAGSLHNHMLRHKGEKNFMCKFCAKQFLTGGQLKVHERKHTKEKVFVCEVCNKGFCHRQSLITHSTIHTGVKPYQCENCGNAFSCVGNLIKHRKTHADTCGLVPLMTHSVKNPSTKIKVRINTPESSKLRKVVTTEELKQKLKICSVKSDSEGKKTFENENQLNMLKKVSLESDNEDNNEFKNEGERKILNKEKDNVEEKHKSIETKMCPFEAEQKVVVNQSEENNFSRDAEEILHENSNDPSDLFESDLSDCNSDFHSENENIHNDNNITNLTTKTNSHKNYQEPKYEKNVINTFNKPKRNKNLDKAVQKFMENRKLANSKEITCKYCSKKYNHVRWLYKHEKKHETLNDNVNEEDKQYFKCSCCLQRFDSKELCKEHQQKEHADQLSCVECDKIFANVDSLRSHHQVYHKGLPRKQYVYICEKCGTKFKLKAQLALHNENDCKEGPFFACNICNKSFSSHYTQKTHMKIHTSEKDLLCKFCGKSFRWKGQLKIHERSHTGEKPFKCLFCPRAFAYRDSLVTHSSMHTGIKPHFCKGCGWRFSCISNLIKHKVTHASTCGAYYTKEEKKNKKEECSE